MITAAAPVVPTYPHVAQKMCWFVSGLFKVFAITSLVLGIVAASWVDGPTSPVLYADRSRAVGAALVIGLLVACGFAFCGYVLSLLRILSMDSDNR